MSNFGSFSYFQTSLSLGVEQGLQKLPKFDINDLRLLFHCYILIPRKCPRKIPFKTQCVWRGGGQKQIYLGLLGPLVLWSRDLTSPKVPLLENWKSPGTMETLVHTQYSMWYIKTCSCPFLRYFGMISR